MEEADEEVDSVDGGDDLEVIAEDKPVQVRVTPQPVLEASVACSETLGGTYHVT